MVTSRAMSIVLVAFALTACGGSSGGTAPPSNPNPGGGGGGGGSGVAPTVTVSNNTYSPDRVTVTRGGSVTWRWDSCDGDVYGGEICVAHSVTFDDGSASAAPQSSGSFVKTFATAGTFTYYCSAHGRASMSGSVVVP